MNRQVRRVGLVLTLMFLALFAMASSIQVIRTEALYQDPRNVRETSKSWAISVCLRDCEWYSRATLAIMRS